MSPTFTMANTNRFLPVFDAYPIRVQVGFALSLAVIVVLVKLPLGPSTDRVGWSPQSSTRPPERIALSEVQSASASDAPLGVSVEDIPPPAQTGQSTEGTATSTENEANPTDSSESAVPPKPELHSVSTLSPTEEEPNIIGGLGQLYLKIDYPKKAREQGIEGRLELEFTVQPDGEATDVTVVNSLHPLCDSAAVEGIRSVEFVPAEHNGTPIPIRMQLPVRFRLVTTPSAPQTAGLSQ